MMLILLLLQKEFGLETFLNPLVIDLCKKRLENIEKKSGVVKKYLHYYEMKQKLRLLSFYILKISMTY